MPSTDPNDPPSTDPNDPPSTDHGDRERGPHEVFCRDCGATINARAVVCPECGRRQGPSPEGSGHPPLDSALSDLLDGGNPFVAAALSAVYPGLGQLYNREPERGVAFMVGSVVALLSALVLVGFLLYPAIWIYSIYDAYTRA